MHSKESELPVLYDSVKQIKLKVMFRLKDGYLKFIIILKSSKYFRNHQKDHVIIFDFLYFQLMVKRLMTHYTMYAKSNTTDVNKEVTKNWEEFLHNNTDFIHPFDFVKVISLSLFMHEISFYIIRYGLDKYE